MLGVVSLLDEANSTFVRELSQGLASEFGIAGIDADASPHVSFHVAESYEIDDVEKRLRSLARSVPPVETRTAGAGIFFGEEHVLYLTVVRNPRLTVLQRTVYDEVRHHATGEHLSYHPFEWVPHITLGRWPAGQDVTGDVMRYLAGRADTLRRELVLDNLSVIEERGETRRVVTRHDLAA